VVFAGSIGRTDLPGGDAAAMAATLEGVVAGLDDRARLLPGHGPATDMARERATNPYLQTSFWEA
jgi:glyoxylase-like metal-dependent hydrolase (beta-lactamase superfamily II)